jgi:hypothetical protein
MASIASLLKHLASLYPMWDWARLHTLQKNSAPDRRKNSASYQGIALAIPKVLRSQMPL